MTEQLPYEVLRDFGDFEIRRYPDHTLVQVQGRGEFASVGYQAFGPLFQFISGSNAASQKIAMTAPVLQEEVAPDSHVVSFVMPKGLSFDKVPAPRDTNVMMTEVAGFDAAVLRFSGSWNAARLHKRASELAEAIQRKGLVSRGNPLFARFNPPWTPGFLKRNEVLIQLDHEYAGDTAD